MATKVDHGRDSDTPADSGGDGGGGGRQGAALTGRLRIAVGAAALGGLLFGYDTGVISSAQLYFVKDFHLSDTMTQIVVASLLLGAVGGVLVGGNLIDRLGRKRTLMLLSGVFVLGSLGSAFAPNAWSLTAARVVLGLCVGASSLAVPSYIAEISPPAIRGRLVSMNQFLITVGILVAYLVGLAFSPIGGWRWMVGLAAVPAGLMLLGVFRIVESPRWLVQQGRDEEALDVLTQLRGGEGAQEELEEIHEAAREEAGTSWKDVLAKPLRPAIHLGVAVAATNQLVGVNAIIYYAPTLLEKKGFGDSAAILTSVGFGAGGAIATLIALLCIDRIGRRPLLLGGTGVIVILLVVLGVLYLLPESAFVRGGLVVTLIAYVVVFNASLGIGIWLMNSEVFPTAVRGKAASFGTDTHWGLDFLISLTVLTLVNLLTASGMFWMFAVFGAIGFVYLFKNLPETKGRKLEEIDASLRARAKA